MKTFNMFLNENELGESPLTPVLQKIGSSIFKKEYKSALLDYKKEVEKNPSKPHGNIAQQIANRYRHVEVRNLMRLIDKLVDAGTWNKKLHAEYSCESVDMPVYAVGGASTGPGMGQYVPVADLNASKKVKLKKKKEEDWSELFDDFDGMTPGQKNYKEPKRKKVSHFTKLKDNCFGRFQYYKAPLNKKVCAYDTDSGSNGD